MLTDIKLKYFKANSYHRTPDPKDKEKNAKKQGNKAIGFILS